MATFFVSFIFPFLILPQYTNSLNFKISRFDPNEPNIIYQGDSVASVGAIELVNKPTYVCRVGWATYHQNLPLYDPKKSSKLANFTTNFSFTIITQSPQYGSGLSFFLGPAGFEIPPNSGGGFLGLFNTTTSDSSRNQIVHVEFDSFPNPEWDPPYEHVGINKGSISSVALAPWSAGNHSGDTTHVWISYDSSAKNLSVRWSYDNMTGESVTSLHYLMDLREILPPWVTIGFSGTTGTSGQRNIINSWEFGSTLDINEGDNINEDKRVRVKLIVGLTVSGGVLVAFFILGFGKWMRKKREKAPAQSMINYDLERGAGPRRFPYEDLACATSNFANERKLGEGGFGTVYRGYLPDLDMLIAVKKISRGSKQGEKEYLTEVKIISQLRHRNLVQLLGWCHEKGEFLLVYEFMPNGSLDTHLFDKRTCPLPWGARYKISLGLASALLYLHEEWERCVVHRDIKSSNIMLDVSSFKVKLGDFGLARLMDHELGPQTTGLAGTLGYMAPEYISTGRASKESDVYSFGVVCLEIATGRKATDKMGEDFSEMGLVQWVWSLYGKGKIIKVVDERLKNEFEEKQVESMIIVGLWCAHPDWSLRPSIRQVIQMLNFEATWPNLPTTMPVPVYHVPKPPLMSSVDPLITSTSILEIGR